MKTVSIVMPLYNVESCMDEAIRSVLDQTYPYWELILVDDGSPDKSGVKADEWVAQYPDRMRVVHQQNKGQGGARNTGVGQASGDYLLFMDSDDTISPNLLEICMGLAAENTDVVVFEHDIRRPDGSLVKTVKSPFSLPPHGDVRTNREYLLVAGMPWNKLFSAAFYRQSQLQFPEKVWYEDFILCTKLMATARHIVYTDQPLYHYFLRPHSTMRNQNADRNREILSAMDEIVSYFKEQKLEQEFTYELCCLAIDNVYITTSLRLIRIDPQHPLIKELRTYMKTRFPAYRHNPYLHRLSAQYRLTFHLLEARLIPLVRLLTTIKDKRR